MVEILGLPLLPAVALLLCVAGVVGSILPGLPGAVLSLSGVLLFWWHTGYTRPGPLLLAVLLGLAMLALLADWFGGAVAAKAGGASTLTTVVAALVGLLLLFVAGPLGVVLGIGGTVFALEYRENGDPEASLRTAAYTTVGMLASAAVQALLTATVLVGMLFVVL
ncbi:DUF456 domain-containing protein [Halorarius halobius]|uniref:DUF456 domain-containing protein n=1 Tax=Halorarius halobius TaxID=2962671 RepID=UPI0020CCDCE6|nr:DUF456 domain-containing protein [Halorarius halobius]